MSEITEHAILWSAITMIILAGGVGMFGMMGMYAIFPVVMIEEPTCECPMTWEIYDRPRQLFSVFGFFFAFIPIIVWRIWINRKLK